MTKWFINKDIEVIILTINRLKYLKKSLESVLNQTQKVKITVLDNASTDGTDQYVSSLMSEYNNLHYVRQKETVPGSENLATAIRLAEAEYVMFFHDDDILHPQYIEYALKALNKFENVDVICSDCTTINQDEIPEIKTISKCACVYFKNKIDFVTQVYVGFHTGSSSIVYPNVIYRTCNVKKLCPTENKYGKIGDKPFVINAIQNSTVQFQAPFLFYRLHQGQDSSNGKNGPFQNEIFNHNKFFKSFMDQNFKTRFLFNIFSAKWLFFLTRMRDQNLQKSEKKEIIKAAYADGVINLYTYLLFFGPLKTILNFINKLFIKLIRANMKKNKDIEYL